MADEPEVHDWCDFCHVTHDCDDCDRLHGSWSAHEAHRAEMEERWPDVLLLVARLEDVLAGADGWTAAEAVGQLSRRHVKRLRR